VATWVISQEERRAGRSAITRLLSIILLHERDLWIGAILFSILSIITAFVLFFIAVVIENRTEDFDLATQIREMIVSGTSDPQWLTTPLTVDGKIVYSPPSGGGCVADVQEFIMRV